MKILTDKQWARQSKQFRNKGRYAKMHPCEICGKSCGAVYYSAEDCNKTGKNVTLCKKCAEKVWKKEVNICPK